MDVDQTGDELRDARRRVCLRCRLNTSHVLRVVDEARQLHGYQGAAGHLSFRRTLSALQRYALYVLLSART